MKKRISEKITLIFVAVFICFSVLLTVIKTQAATTDENPDGYTPIYTVEDLYGIKNDTSGNYILMADIDLSGTKPGGEWDTGYGWHPIEEFSGILDGNGHRINNMTIYDSVDNKVYPSSMMDEYGIKGIGLFRKVEGGTIKNLGLTNIDIHIEKEHVQDGIGGIASRLAKGIISNCYVTGVINVPLSSNAGGIVGNVNPYDSLVRNCYADVDVSGQSFIGGIAGFCYSARETVNYCYALGSVKIINGSSAPTGASPWDGSAKPVVGNVNYGKNYYLVTNGSEEGAVGLTQSQAKLEKCYTGFDFVDTWVLDKHSPFPYPQLRSCMQVRTESIELISPPDKLSYTEGEKIDFSGSKLQINYEDGYSVEVPLEETMASYKMKEGEQTVIVSYNGKSTQFFIHVEPVPETLKITAKKTKLKVGAFYTYKAAYTGNGTVEFSSSNSNILRIDRISGIASAKKAGKVTVTVKAGNLKKTIKVKVVKK